MNGVNLNSPELKLVRTDAQAPVEALSSSQVQGESFRGPAPSSDISGQAQSAGASTEVAKSAKPEEAKEDGRESLSQAVSQLNDFVQNVQRDLQFEVDNEKGQTIVKVVDQRTHEVIRQIPDEVALRLAENLQQDEPLTLFNIKV